MVERFFFNRINAKTAGASISREHDLAALVGADKAQALLALA
jgi:hypothetical protein